MRRLSDGKLNVRTVVEAREDEGYNSIEAKSMLLRRMGDMAYDIYRKTSDASEEQWTPPKLSRKKTVVLSRKMKSTLRFFQNSF